MGLFPGARTALLALACGLCVRCAFAAPASPQPQRTDLITDMPAAGDLAAPANGQTLYVLDEARGEVVAIDPFDRAAKRWTAVSAGPRADTSAGTLAIGCIDTSMLAMLCRSREGWSLQTHRLQPGTAADPDKPAQSVVIGRTTGDAAAAATTNAKSPGDHRACLAISPSRDWLGVCGLPSPLPAVMRAPIAGARIGGVSARACPSSLRACGPPRRRSAWPRSSCSSPPIRQTVLPPAFSCRFIFPLIHADCCISTRHCRWCATRPSAAPTARSGWSAAGRGVSLVTRHPPWPPLKDSGGSMPSCGMAGRPQRRSAWPVWRERAPSSASRSGPSS